LKQKLEKQMPLHADMLPDLCRIAPELILCSFGILLVLLEPFVLPDHKRALGWLGFSGSLVAIASLWIVARHPGPAYGGLIQVDDFSLFFHAVILGAVALVILGSINYLCEERLQRGEYYALVLFAAAGMGILAGAGELITAFLGLEMSSISTYVLAAFRRDVRKSNESALKYFILGSFATAFFLYGIAMTYGATGTTRFAGIAQALGATGPTLLAVLGLGMMMVGLGFKVVIAPFQIYAPDVYEGAPTPVTALLASAPKAAAFALMLRIFYVAFGPVQHIWFWAIWISAVLTMCIGNFAALLQTNVKRMLAYSSIAHAGYILVAFAASTEVGIAAVLFYLAAYALMKIGAFTVVTHVGGQGERHLDLSDYAGLAKKQPAIAACFTLFLPITGGFMGKFYAFQAGIDSGLIWLVVIAALNSVVGSYYYLRVILAMYFREPAGESGPDSGNEWMPKPVAASVWVALIACALGTLYLGLLPSQVMEFALRSAASLR
jgi:NADH-quinone oxidoreductase subunit N